MSNNESDPVIGEDVDLDIENNHQGHPRHARKRRRHSDTGEETGECSLIGVYMWYIYFCRYVGSFYTPTCQHIKLIIEHVFLPEGSTHVYTERIDECHHARSLGYVHGNSTFENGDGTIESAFEWSSRGIEWAGDEDRKEGGSVGESERNENENVCLVSSNIYCWNPLLTITIKLRVFDSRWASFSTSDGHGVTKSVIDRVDLTIQDTTLRPKIALRKYLFSNYDYVFDSWAW